MSYTSNPQSIGLTAPPGVAVLMVASEPGRALVDVVEPLVEAGTAAILVVDDGSSSARQWVLDRISMEPTVHLLRHAKPQGHGAALKSGMQYFAQHFRHYSGLVTTTADGQYAAVDVLRVMRALHRSPKLVILGACEGGQRLLTSNGGVQPLTLRHRILRLVFRALTGVGLTDVQTRLRAIPAGLLPRLMKIPGTRYDYEVAMLLHIARSAYPMAEHSIFGNAEIRFPDAGFHPLADSFDVLRALLNCTPVEQDNLEHASESARVSDERSHGPGASRAKQTR